MVVYFASSVEPEDAIMRARAPFLFMLGALMVLGQLITAASIMVGSWLTSCGTNQHCPIDGKFCNGYNGRCVHCGAIYPFVYYIDGKAVVEAPTKPGFTGFNRTLAKEICMHPEHRFSQGGQGGVVLQQEWSPKDVLNWCDACVSGPTSDVKETTEYSISVENVDSMVAFDWVTLVFCAIVIGHAVVGEIKDIFLCRLAIRHAGERLGRGWRVALITLNGVRRVRPPVLFLPLLYDSFGRVSCFLTLIATD